MILERLGRCGDGGEQIQPGFDLLSGLKPFLGQCAYAQAPNASPGREPDPADPIEAPIVDKSALQEKIDSARGDLSSLCMGVVELCHNTAACSMPSLCVHLMALGNLLQGTEPLNAVLAHGYSGMKLNEGTVLTASFVFALLKESIC